MSKIDNSTLAALVTGANKGIGLEIVRQLSPKFSGTVYLTARDLQRGKEALKTLQAEGLHNVKFQQMDVNDKKSVEHARDAIRDKHGGLDILINNAGILVFSSAGTVDQSAGAVKDTMTTNFTGLLNVCNVFFPILRPHARVVNVASTIGSLGHLKIDQIKKRLVADDLTVEEVEKIVQDYIKLAETSKHVETGYPDQYGPYSMSKIAVIALSRVQQRVLDQDHTRADIIVNACCPGYCATDINRHSGYKTAIQGADTPAYLVLLPPATPDAGTAVKPRGQFVFERRVVDWAGGEDPTKYSE